MTAAQTSTGATGGGSTPAPVEHHEHIDTLDKPADYDPDVLGAYGLEATTCWACDGTGNVDDGDRLCPQCLGGGVV